VLVILDTTETFSDPFLKNGAFTVLRSLVSKGLITLIVPTIVVEETINHYRRNLENAVRAIGPLKRLTPTLFENFPEIDVDLCVQDYSCSLLARLQELGVRQPNYNGVSINALVARALRGRKPFDSNGQRGFRDAIIWETILQQLKESRCAAILVTRNKTDFGEDGSLAKDLTDDLIEREFPANCVRVAEGIARCLSSQLSMMQEAVELEEAIKEGKSAAFDARGFFESSKPAILDQLNESVEDDPEGEVHYRRLRVIELGKLERFEVCGIWSITDDKLFIHIDYIVNSRVEYEKYQERWNPIERRFQILVNMMIALNPATHDLIDQGVSKFQFWPDNVSDKSEEEYLSRG
jgi:hypothetical protein